MTYTTRMTVDPLTGDEYELVTKFDNGRATSFVNEESNTGHARAAYLEWLEQGNEPEVIEG